MSAAAMACMHGNLIGHCKYGYWQPTVIQAPVRIDMSLDECKAVTRHLQPKSTPAKALAGGRGAAVSGSQPSDNVAPPTSIGVHAGLNRSAGVARRGPRKKGGT